MRHFEEFAAVEYVSVADFSMHSPVNVDLLTSAIKDVIGETGDKIPNQIPNAIRAAIKLNSAVALGCGWVLDCANKCFFELRHRELNWDHSEIKEIK